MKAQSVCVCVCIYCVLAQKLKMCLRNDKNGNGKSHSL